MAINSHVVDENQCKRGSGQTEVLRRWVSYSSGAMVSITSPSRPPNVLSFSGAGSHGTEPKNLHLLILTMSQQL